MDKSEEIVIEEGSGNVFADLGLANPEERLEKATLASAIQDVIRTRGLIQAQAATVMGIDQPKVSNLVRGRLRGFSSERLLVFLINLGLDLDITIHAGRHENGLPQGVERGKIRVAYEGQVAI